MLVKNNIEKNSNDIFVKNNIEKQILQHVGGM